MRQRRFELLRATTSVVFLPAIFLASFTAAPVRTQDEGGFVPLFNGRDLTGWVNVNCAPETWSVRDGMIHSTGKPICELRTARMYENFILDLEYKHVVPGGNAGLFIWGDALTARGQPFVRAIEVQILDGRNTENYTSHGDVFPIHGATMTPDRPHPGGWVRSLPNERRARPAGAWNHYRVTAQNGAIKLAVNGMEVSGGYDISPRKGYIHLESEGGEVQYRNLRLRELPSSGRLSPDQVAREDEGFVTLYNGTDFRGWRHTADHTAHWIAKDWILAYDGKGQGPAGELSTEQTFGDATVIVDWRAPAGADASGVPFRLGPGDLPAGAAEAVAKSLVADSNGKPRWHRALLTKRGGRLSLTIDDKAVFQDVDVPGAASAHPLTLRHAGSSIEFANLFVKR